VLRDARTVPAHGVLETDVCVVGAGAAGITLARELAQAPVRVTVLESGGLTADRRVQRLLRGRNVGARYFPLDWIRTAAFGGTTDQWGGQCRPLDEIDFEARPEIPGSGWPFGLQHLQPYYQQAQAVCGLGPPVYDAEAWADPATRPALALKGDRALTTIFQFSPPTRFGLAYREDLERASRITVYLHASATELETTDAGRTVTHARVACLGGPRFRVTARLFVLAAGGLETPRLLLLSTGAHPTGLGNQHDLVGRYFMEHPHFDCGAFALADPGFSPAFYEPHLVGRTCVKGALVLSPDTLRREGLLPACVFLDPFPPTRLQHARSAARRLLLPEGVAWRIATRRARRRRNPRPERSRLWAARRTPLTFTVQVRTEQAPNPESRVTLGEARDPLGRRQLRLDWRLTSLDTQSVRRALAILREEVAAAGLGRWDVALDQRDDGTWRTPPHGGHHHMGTTRMHPDPRRGVVDADGKVHGTANLYVAGPSVFPAVGHANPMLTIVALALRLADHVRARLS
jgi:choline dehydrogenase-like flavoprotein